MPVVMFWMWAILGAVAYLLIAGSILLFLRAASRARKRCDRLWLESRGARPEKRSSAA